MADTNTAKDTIAQAQRIAQENSKIAREAGVNDVNLVKIARKIDGNPANDVAQTKALAAAAGAYEQAGSGLNGFKQMIGLGTSSIDAARAAAQKAVGELKLPAAQAETIAQSACGYMGGEQCKTR